MLLLKEAAEIIEHYSLLLNESPPPNDFQSIKHAILQLELQQEVDFLSELRAEAKDDTEYFKYRFWQRCQQRSEGAVASIAFSAMPESKTNQLYRQLAERLFQPESLADLLAVLLPNVCSKLSLSFNEDIPSGLSLKQLRQQGLDPELTLEADLVSLRNESTEVSLSHFVISGRLIFDVRDIVQLPLQVHSKLYEVLTRDYPELSAKLYEHNWALNSVKEAIDTYRKRGKTVNEALSKLICVFEVDGERVTGKAYTSELAMLALDEFFTFLNGLPDDIRECILAEKSGAFSLHEVLHQELLKGRCVETAASHLRQILQANQNNPLFHQAVKMTPEALSQLKKRHHRVSSERDDHKITALPEVFFRQVVADLRVDNASELALLLVHFPCSLYEALLRDIEFDRVEKLMFGLNQLIKAHWLTEEQNNALVEAVIKLQAKFFPEGNGSILMWVIYTQVPQYVQMVLEEIPEENRLQVILREINEAHSFEWQAVLPSSLELLLKALSLEHSCALLQACDFEGFLLLRYFKDNFASLKTLLMSYPIASRIQILNAMDNWNRTLLHYLSDFPFMIKEVLTDLSLNDQLDLLELRDYNGRTAIHLCVWDTACILQLQELLIRFSPEDRVKLLMSYDGYGRTAIAMAAESRPEHLTILIKLLPQSRRVEAISTIDSHVPKEVQCKLYHCLDISNKVRLAYPAYEQSSALFSAPYFQGQTPYGWLFKSLDSPFPFDALVEVLEIYVALRSEDPSETFHHPLLTFLGGGYTKSQEVSALQLIIDILSNRGALNPQQLQVFRQGEPKKIISAWEKQYQRSMDELHQGLVLELMP